MDARDRLRRAVAEQHLIDLHERFGGDRDFMLLERIESFCHASANRVLVGNEAVVNVALHDLLEDQRDLGEIGVLHTRAEVPHRRQMTECPGRPEISNAQRKFEREAA